MAIFVANFFINEKRENINFREPLLLYSEIYFRKNLLHSFCYNHLNYQFLANS